MCGICGWFGGYPDGGPAVTERMAALLRHRGPDDDGFEYGQGWGLGFRRLSILDLSQLGHQPMRSPDGRYWLVFNGEIYNYLELRKELEQLGEVFHSGSDTEVLLRLLARHGTDALGKLNGMFALAFVDTMDRTFLLARDRLGVKPLYYTIQNGGLYFASELKALLSRPNAPRQIDPIAVIEYIALGYLSSERCIFSGYSKLPPGHMLTGSLDRPEQARPNAYWRLRLSDASADRTMTADEMEFMHNLLLDAVRIRLRSDVPLGVFLSGGIDSGLVAAVAAQVSDRPPLALTVGFSEKEADETELASATARRLGLEHRVMVQRPGDLNDIDRLSWFYDEPFGDSSALPTFTLCEAASQHATVFLSGDGGDEAFGGYRRYMEGVRHEPAIRLAGLAAWGLQSVARFVPEMTLTHHRLRRLGLPDHGAAAAIDHDLPNDPAIWMVIHPDMRNLAPQAGRPIWERWNASRGASLTTRQRQLDYDLYLPDDVLVKVDRASMAHSIEVRSPFLDYRLVEWAAKLPRSALLNTKEGKLPLRMLAARLLPETVERGVKRGFGVPNGSWFRQPAGIAMVRERLLSVEAQQLGLWSSDGVEHILKLHQSSRSRDFGLLLWRLLMLASWANHYLDGATLPAGSLPAVLGKRSAVGAQQLRV